MEKERKERLRKLEKMGKHGYTRGREQETGESSFLFARVCRPKKTDKPFSLGGQEINFHANHKDRQRGRRAKKRTVHTRDRFGGKIVNLI